jgi:hypothetical protein
LTAESILQYQGGTVVSNTIYKDIFFQSTQVNSVKGLAAVYLESDAATTSTVIMENCVFESSNSLAKGIFASVKVLSIHQVTTSAIASADFFASGSTATRMHLGENEIKAAPLDFATATTNLPANCIVYQNILGERQKLSFPTGLYGCTWFASAVPITPPTGYFLIGSRLTAITPVSGGSQGWVNTSSGWKTAGSIAA